MKNIILSVVMVAALIAGGVGGVFANWSDEETGTICFTAGFNNLEVDIDGEVIDPLNGAELVCQSHLEPGDSGSSYISLHAYSDDSPVTLIVTSHVLDLENGCLEPEETVGDDPNSDVGELSGFLHIVLTLDDMDATDGPGAAVEIYNGTAYDLMTVGSAQMEMITCHTYHVTIDWDMTGATPGDANVCMTDSVSGVITFTASNEPPT